MMMALILGSGSTGQSAERWCKRQGLESVLWLGDSDSRDIKDLVQNFVIQSPGISPNHPIVTYLKSLNVDITNDIDIFISSVPPEKCLGVTGTNGKSTTTALTHHILKEAFGDKAHMGGNIGVPVLDLPCSPDNSYVLELSSYQLEISQKLALFAGVLLNITPDHLERHKTMDAYIDAKKKIFARCEHPIICIDDVYTKAIYQEFKQKAVSLSTKQKADFWVNKNSWLVMDETPMMDLKNLFLKGEHNYQNILASFALTYVFGISTDLIINAIQTFKGLAHRLEIVKSIKNVLYVNDSKATNAEATEKALLAYKDFEIYLILGGKAKSDGIKSLRPYFPLIHKAYLIGEAAENFHCTLGTEVVHALCETLEKAVDLAAQDASASSKNAVVLLSPACASFDQFKNFEERGDMFKKLVYSIKK